MSDIIKLMFRKLKSPRIQFVLALLVSSLVSIGLFLYGAWRNHDLSYNYLIWNLMLAWLPLLFAARLMVVLKHKLWSSWEAMTLSLLWLVFLPNSFYMISDFIHIREVPRVDVLYDAIMFSSFIYTGVIIGFTSLILIHLQFKRRLGSRLAAAWVAFTLLVCSIGVYIGRDLRWNSWDILTNPGALLVDISDRLQHPAAYPKMLLTIATFFILLTSMYNLIWRGSKMLLHIGMTAAKLTSQSK